MVTINSPEAENEPKLGPIASFMALFAARARIYQAKVSGKFRQAKWILMSVLLGIYYLAPFIRWNRGGDAPDQAILIDIIGRKFYFFFIELWPQEIYYFTGLLLIAALCLFLFTTLFGRVWCGYACPQTVWTDLFYAVERFFEGDRNAAMRFADAPWSVNKMLRKAGKHLTWLLIGALTGGAWILYFNDAPTLLRGFAHGEFPFVPTFWIGFLTFSTYLLAGFAREQVCTYMCPYARFQGAMFDEDSLIVTYDAKRGEPRSAGKAKDSSSGDCIDCLRCVAVCPTGIDIRDGQQYRCINCGLCIDACNAVMDKIGKPHGLIRYNNLAGTIPPHTNPWQMIATGRLLRPRVLYYITIITLVGSAMMYALLTRPLVHLSALHLRNPLYTIMSNHAVRNTYTVRIVNKTWSEKTYKLSSSAADAKLTADTSPNAADGALLLTVKPGKVGEFMVFIDRPVASTPIGNTPLELTMVDTAPLAAGKAPIQTRYATMFIAPNPNE